MAYQGSYLWNLRQLVGSQLLLVPGAQVLVLDGQDRALFQQRTDDQVWALPAGACEPGEDFTSTAIHELAEESGLLVDREDLVPFGCLSDSATAHAALSERRSGARIRHVLRCPHLVRSAPRRPGRGARPPVRPAHLPAYTDPSAVPVRPADVRSVYRDGELPSTLTWTRARISQPLAGGDLYCGGLCP